ncbi:MAG: hypothetical protein JXB49_33705 [Bacteroidales bacterium]|nr:hypothetical protein [Bacteroidales bacterium]
MLKRGEKIKLNHWAIAGILSLVSICCSQKVKEGFEIAVDKKDGALQIAYRNKPLLYGENLFMQKNETMSGPVTITNNTILFNCDSNHFDLVYEINSKDNIIGFGSNDQKCIDANNYSLLKMFVNNIPDFSEGVALIHDESGNQEYVPVHVKDLELLKSRRVDFFLWQYRSGYYGILKSFEHIEYSEGIIQTQNTNNPGFLSLIYGFGNDPYLLIGKIDNWAKKRNGMSDSLNQSELLPEPLQYIGWSTRRLQEAGLPFNSLSIVASIKAFHINGFPLASVIIEDENSLKTVCSPDHRIFPKGYKSFIQKVNNDNSVHYVGISNLNCEEECTKLYADEGFSFIKIFEEDDIDKSNKVSEDNACISAARYFNDAVMVSNGLMEEYDLLSSIYSKLSKSNRGYPVYSDFRSSQEDAAFVALTRTLSNDPIFISDIPGKQDFKILKAISFPDGKAILSDAPLLPTKDCLFQLSDTSPLKLFTYSNDVGIILICNISEADNVEGTFMISDIWGIQGEMFVLYDYFNRVIQITDKTVKVQVSLHKGEYRLYFALPFKQPFVPIGLISKYNAPKTIRSVSYSEERLRVTVYGEGPLAIASTIEPTKITANSCNLPFHYQDQLLIIDIPSVNKEQTIEVLFNREK